MLARIRELQLQVTWILETHAHADHLSAAAYMKDALGCQVATGAGVCEVQVTAAHMFDLEAGVPHRRLAVRALVERRRSLPHRRGRLLGDRDAGPHARLGHLSDRRLRVRRRHVVPAVSRHGALRFSRRQRGAELYDSIRKLYRLPDATRVMVGHDYPESPADAAYCSDVRSEKQSNVHLSAATTREDFIAFREQRDRTLPLPELFFFALQVNVRAGRFPAEGGQRHAPAARADSSAARIGAGRSTQSVAAAAAGALRALSGRRTGARPGRSPSCAALRRADPCA